MVDKTQEQPTGSSNTAQPSNQQHPDAGTSIVRTRSRTGSLPSTSRNQSVFSNLMQGKSTRGSRTTSRKSVDQVDEVPEPVKPPNNGSTTHQELDTIQQVCEQSNENIRQQLREVNNKVDDLSNKPPVNGQATQDGSMDAMRKELNEKIDGFVKSQPDFNTLFNELFTLRRDTNALLEFHSTQQREPQTTAPPSNQSPRNSVKQENEQEPVKEEDEPNVLDQLPSRVYQRQAHHQAQSNNQSRDSRKSKKTTTRSYVHNRRYDVSSDSDSYDEPLEHHDQSYDDEDTSASIPFFIRKKGPQHEGLNVIKPADPIYDRLLNYRYYRLSDTRQTRSAMETKLLREQTKSFQTSFDKTKFNGEDPVMVFDFLMKFVEEADTLHVSEAHAFLILPKVLSGRADRQLRSVRNGSRSGGVTCWPEAVNYLLRTYATAAATRNACNDFRNIRQQAREEEVDFSGRLNDAAHRCGNVFDEIEKMSVFVNGLLPSTQTAVARYRESQPRSALSYEELVQYAQDEGDTHRARTASLRVVKAATPNKNDRVVHFMEPSQAGSQATDEGVEVYVMEDGSIDTDQLPSTAASSADTLLYLNDNRRKNTAMVRPPVVPHQDKGTNKNRPGWETKVELICYTCYVVGDHTSPKCNVPISDMQRIVSNYEALTDEQRSRVPSDSYQLAKKYLGMKRELSSDNRETVNNINESESEADSKNE